MTANFLLNLRAAPAGAEVIGDVPWKATMRALERTVGWFKVDYEGKVGWLAAMYLETQGNCELGVGMSPPPQSETCRGDLVGRPRPPSGEGK